MKITTAWTDNGDEGITMVSAYTETDFDVWGGVPNFYSDDVKGVSEPIRELVIEIPDDAVRRLFRTSTIAGTVTNE